MRGAIVIATATAALALGACGPGARESDLRAVADRFLSAVDARDGAAACALLTPGARDELVSSQGEPCSRAVVGLRVGAPPAGRAQVFVTNGAAVASRGKWLFLDDTSSGWRVSAVGCTPRPGGRPYDCELAA